MHWCTNLCVIKTQKYGYIRDSGGSVESPHRTIIGCEKSQNGYKEGVSTVGDFFWDKYTSPLVHKSVCYKNSGVWLYTGLWRFCWILPRNLRRMWKKWKRVSKLQISFLSLRLSSNLSLLLLTPARPCFLGPHWSKRKSTQASGTLLSLVQSHSSRCTAFSAGLGRLANYM